MIVRLIKPSNVFGTCIYAYHSTAMPKVKQKLKKQVPNGYVVNYDKAAVLPAEKSALEKYIKSQENCPGKTITNKIVSTYQSKSGGGAVLSGLFDERIHAWVLDRIKPHKTWSLEPNVQLEIADVKSIQSHWYADYTLCKLLVFIA